MKAGSSLRSSDGGWETMACYQQSCPYMSLDKFMQVTDLLLENPNLNSTHLFRADILFDSANTLKTASQKEQTCGISPAASAERPREGPVETSLPQPPKGAPVLDDAILERTVYRKLVPRKPQLDRALNQWCYIYRLAKDTALVEGCVVVYVPDVESESDMPWYHPPTKSLAYLYEKQGDAAVLSVHFLPFSPLAGPLPARTHRTFVSLLETFLRLAKISAPPCDGGSSSTASMAPSALKDTILPQHVVQDTYSILKQKYAQDLISRWAEKTEPSKHVFEDLSIAAFLIELWKQVYMGREFPGFIDLACGNGVLSYVLIHEGYKGRGFDARRRKTWEILEMDAYLDEKICVPQPFLLHAPAPASPSEPHHPENSPKIHTGMFEPGTFIISNHADELTLWTPLLAAMSSPASPLPFLAIPCCSHALSGAKHRYAPKDSVPRGRGNQGQDGREEQMVSGDLKALRTAKVAAANHADDKSTYACLTRKLVSICRELDIDSELTLMRIPSTRNIGVLGNRKHAFASRQLALGDQLATLSVEERDVLAQVANILERECGMSGGVREAARLWTERALKIQGGRGRGKLNLGSSREHRG